MNFKYTITDLTEKSVSIKTQPITVIDSVEYELGLPSRKAYINTLEDRIDLLKEVPEEVYNAVIAMWGNEPMINDAEAVS